MKLTKSRLKELIKEVYDTEGAPSEETEEDIQASLEEAYTKLHNALDVASRLKPDLALEIGPIAHSVGELLNEEPEDEPEDDYEESLRRRYDKEEAAARREGPSTPWTQEKIAALWDDDEEDW
jgi:hypothetical protein